MTNINISYGELQESSSQIAVSRDQIYAELDKLKSKIDGLVSNGFVTDGASKAFQAAYERFTTGARSTIQGLDDVIRFLKIAEQTYRDTDSQLASALK
jgi:WXG100 family type VII secretion target